MKLGRLLVTAAALAVCGASAAQAGTKFMISPPIPQNLPTLQTMYCDITNLNKTDKTVTIEILDTNGAVISGGGPTMVMLTPNEATAFGGFSTGAYCRFTVDGSTKKYRAVAIYDNGTDYTISVPAY
jgi:hypothetical protein